MMNASTIQGANNQIRQGPPVFGQPNRRGPAAGPYPSPSEDILDYEQLKQKGNHDMNKENKALK